MPPLHEQPIPSPHPIPPPPLSPIHQPLQPPFVQQQVFPPFDQRVHQVPPVADRPHFYVHPHGAAPPAPVFNHAWHGVAPPVPIINPVEISITDTKLPSLATIPFLKTAVDWVPWFAAVSRLIASIGLRGHICRIPAPGDLIDPTSCAVLPPHYDFESTPEEAENYRIFWANDEVADHVLVGKLAPEIAHSLPPKHGGQFDMPIRTARDTLAFLKKRFSVGSAATADLTKDKVFALSITAPAQVASYVEAWRSAVSQLAGLPWDFTSFQSTQKFVNGLPNFGEYTILKEKVRNHWRFHNSLDNASFDFATLADDVMDIDATFRNNRKPKPKTTSSNNNAESPSTSFYFRVCV
ncbi:hypothetical protein C0992_004191 [Termitomyces sp. T32_za158]|nr:hypothetical protein C0992_004191 [Termitomyces sp. T32_za158]